MDLLCLSMAVVNLINLSGNQGIGMKEGSEYRLKDAEER
jgi:hypothetical protein